MRISMAPFAETLIIGDREIARYIKGTTLLSDEEIEAANLKAPYRTNKRHEHNDCNRIAYEWHDAQKKTARPVRRPRMLKHYIEEWGGRYVSTDDVEVAARNHPDLIGRYPNYNISTRLVCPSETRLDQIGEAGKHASTYRSRNMAPYKSYEDDL